MKNILLTDDMKEESKIWIGPMIVFFIFTIVCPFGAKFIYKGAGFADTDIVIYTLFFFLTATFFLYGYLRVSRYKVKVTEEKIILKTLFKSIEVNISDIKEYSYKKNRRSAFYIFTIYYLDKKIVICTHYYQELDKILSEAKTNN